jgi:tripartite-type tricarboxylate transporter receptor subunit TctC
MLIAPFAQGQEKDFPNRPVKVIVTTTPGSTADTKARFFGEQLAGIFGQPFIVENRPGGDGVIGVMAVKNAPADGHTLLLGSNSLLVNPIVTKGLSYDFFKDLKPVYGTGMGMNVFIVAADSPLNTLADLVDAAKKSKQPLNVGTSFASYRLSAEWFASLAGVKFNQIPYKGTAQVVTDVMGHHLDFGFVDWTVAGPLWKSGKLKALAVGGGTRHPDAPEVPTVRESGYLEFTSFAWSAFFVRSDTPDDVVTKLADAMQKVMATDVTKEFLKKMNQLPPPGGPVAMRKYLLEEVERYRRVAEVAGIKPE